MIDRLLTSAFQLVAVPPLAWFYLRVMVYVS